MCEFQIQNNDGLGEFIPSSPNLDFGALSQLYAVNEIHYGRKRDKFGLELGIIRFSGVLLPIKVTRKWVCVTLNESHCRSFGVFAVYPFATE